MTTDIHPYIFFQWWKSYIENTFLLSFKCYNADENFVVKLKILLRFFHFSENATCTFFFGFCKRGSQNAFFFFTFRFGGCGRRGGSEWVGIGWMRVGHLLHLRQQRCCLGGGHREILSFVGFVSTCLGLLSTSESNYSKIEKKTGLIFHFCQCD